jgi:2,3-diaminopropionate biosynthesis protein SbnB
MTVDWPMLTAIIRETVQALDAGDTAQPLKPYLRYRDPQNRIIAMPAFVGGNTNRAGLKWISSFPDNVRRGSPRAHCVIIVNDAQTGVPVGIVNSSHISSLRTAAVSALMLQCLEDWLSPSFRAGIIGLGPIGRCHLQMLLGQYGNRLSQISLYDHNDSLPDRAIREHNHQVPLVRCSSWQDVFRASDVIITCTVADTRYIDDAALTADKLLLHVSLRDYMPHVLRSIPLIIVDSWEEVCREQTDIERWRDEAGGSEEQVHLLQDVVCRGTLQAHAKKRPSAMFCPMGMAVFDIALANHLLTRARAEQRGRLL